MGDLKPIGSEKLTGDAKIKRIMEIARFGETNKNTENHTSTISFKKKSVDGNTYAIIQERDGYYLKCGLNESKLEYISGFMNKKRDRFKSYAGALKRMNLIFKPLNEEFNEGIGDGMYEQYTTVVTNEENEVDEQEKFVLNVPNEGGDEDVDMDVDMGMDDDMGDEDMDMDLEADVEGEDMDADVEGEVEGEEDMEGFMKSIQKLTGKLGQKLRDVEEEMGSADIKYVLNSIISAVDLESLDDEDKDDVLERFEEDDEASYGDEEEMDIDMDDMGDEEIDMGDDVDMDMDMDMGVEDEEIAMESLKNRVSNLLESYIVDKKKVVNPEEYLLNKVKNLNLENTIRKYSKSIEQEFGVKKFIKENKGFKLQGITKGGDIKLTSSNKKVLITKQGVIK